MSIYERFDVATCPKRALRRLCAEAFGVEEHRLVGHSRKREVVIPRHATFYALRHQFPAMSLPRLGRFMGGRDHSTVLHGIRNIEAHMARDPALKALVLSLAAGKMPVDHDCHVRAWRAEQALRALTDAKPAPPPVVRRLDDDGTADDGEPFKLWCGQCDRAVLPAAAARCRAAFCKAQVAA